jgi:hypothetical protein
MGNSNISFNPSLTTNAAGTFGVSSDGYIQGLAMDSPSIRSQLAGGVLSAAETLPMWGGIALFESIALSTVNGNMGPTVGRALTAAAIAGFSVFNQAHNWVTSPQSEAPSAGAGMMVPFYRIGSDARIAVACDPSLVSLDGGATNQQVSWDFNNQRLQAYDAATATYALTSITSSYANGVYTFVVVAAVPTLAGGVGDAINVSGVTGTGAALVNGNQNITAFTDNQHFTFTVNAASAAIATGALAGTLLMNAGVAALPLYVRVLHINIGNSKIIQYDAVNNLVHWNPAGSCALIIL